MCHLPVRSALLVAVLAAAAACGSQAAPELSHDSSAELDRIRSHLTRVESELRDRDVSHLDPDARAARLETLAWLAEYREEGRFPHNHVLPGERTPVFVDPHGTACAVGYLLLRSGEEELVARVVETDNLVRIPELAGDPELEGWLERRGLTLDEAARIQPAYDGFQQRARPSTEAVTVAVGLASAGLQLWGLAASPPDGGADALGILALGAAGAHGFLAFAGATDRIDSDGWAVAVNGLFAIADGVLGVSRFRNAPADPPAPGVVTVRPTVGSRHGAAALGLRIGF